MSGRSAVIVRIPLPADLERLRQRHDPVADVGVPAHVSLVFPWLPSDELTPAVRRVLAAVAVATRPFEVRFERAARFPDVLWLEPEPGAPFRELTERIVAAFPAFPPYEGVFDEVIPHLTLARGDDALLDRLGRQVASCGPVRAPIRAIEVIAEAGSGGWHRRWRVPLGPSAQGRSFAPLGSRHIGRRTGTPGAGSTSASTRKPNCS